MPQMRSHLLVTWRVWEVATLATLYPLTNSPIHDLGFLSPMPLDEIPASPVVVDPVRGRPARVASRRALPSSPAPDVLAAVPRVKAGDPHVLRTRGRNARFDDRPWRCEAHVHP